jgi:hypothetical protein
VHEIRSDLLAELSETVFGGGQVPNDLAALWAAQEADDTDLLDAFEMVLFAGIDVDEVIAPFADDDDSDPDAIAALERMLRTITFVAEALDGTLLGYWTPDGDGAPVVVTFDEFGQLAVLGRTMAGALIALTDPEDPEEASEVATALVALGVTGAPETVEAALAAVYGIPDPNEVVLGYMVEIRLTRAAG